MFCSKCGAQNDDSARFCQKCGSPLAAPSPNPPPPAQGPAPPQVQAPPPLYQAPPIPVDPRMRGGPQMPPMVAGKVYATGKTPWVAVLLSFLLAGVGQFYNGDTKKGAIMLVAGIVLIFTIVGYLGIMVWSMIDAYQVASGKSPLW
jgi:TM2 domain-containing membrane protein YozV